MSLLPRSLFEAILRSTATVLDTGIVVLNSPLRSWRIYGPRHRVRYARTQLDIAMTLSLTRPYPDPTLYRVGSGRLKYL
jgi:hypothetical protein